MTGPNLSPVSRASQLTAALENREWAQSVPEATSGGDILASESISSQSLRRSRASARANATERGTPDLTSSTASSTEAHADQKTANEAFFKSLGAVSPTQNMYQCAGLMIRAPIVLRTIDLPIMLFCP